MTTEKILNEPNKDGISIILSGGQTLKVERSGKLEAKLEARRATLGYQTAYFKEVFSDELWQAMEHQGLNQAQFAEKATVSKQFLTKVFKGENCTMDTIVQLTHALGYNAHIHLTPINIKLGFFQRAER